MEHVQSRSRVRPARLLLFALLAALAWCLLSLLAPTSSASADDGQRGSGLLGAVGDTLAGVSDTLEQTTGVVDAVVTEVVTPVAPPVVAPVPAPVAEPVVTPPPAPVAQPVPVVPAVPDVVAIAPSVADAVIDTVNATAAATVDDVTSAVSEVGAAGTVSRVTAPIIDLAGSLPVVRVVADRLELADTVGTVADSVDRTVASVIGTPTPTGPLLPPLPAPGVDVDVDVDPIVGELPSGITPVRAEGVLASLRGDVTDDATAEPAPHVNSARAGSGLIDGTAAVHPSAEGSPSVGGPSAVGPDPVSGSTTAANGGAGAGAPAALGYEDSHADAAAGSALRSVADDALPGAPVYDTDISPD
ncbi:hypothetical protein ACTU3I_02345 [Microbacterium sp. RD1]|uniref:hypothetical protein n=1 Tax=Microbacterium sp. RD1 TaxID=3457313 RepID=UPI003FA5B32D